ncbi:Oligoketide cyclase/lipid transport protein [Candidatus Terasakiella magnetica]|nr:Oligoketide cyclase/lipid transport protein [Candidatus Terasakiella magnetica]
MGGLSGGWRVDFPHHDCDKLFALAVDIESYPRFLPWCRSARIRHHDGNVLQVENRFGAGPLQINFRSRAVLDRPHSLEITSSDGPFHSFALTWRFEPLGTTGGRVVAQYRMELRSGLMQSLAHLSLGEIERRVVRNFTERVRAVYGR